jgi:hypothetical protein
MPAGCGDVARGRFIRRASQLQHQTAVQAMLAGLEERVHCHFFVPLRLNSAIVEHQHGMTVVVSSLLPLMPIINNLLQHLPIVSFSLQDVIACIGTLWFADVRRWNRGIIYGIKNIDSIIKL